MICHRCDGVVGSDCSCNDNPSLACEGAWYPGKPMKCEGCEKFTSVCVCKTVLPMDVNNIKNELKKTDPQKKLAEELREAAAQALDIQTRSGAHQLVKDITTMARQSASNGKFELEFRFNTYHYSVASAELAVVALKEHGFTASYFAQTYSSGNQEYTHLVRVSWK